MNPVMDRERTMRSGRHVRHDDEAVYDLFREAAELSMLDEEPEHEDWFIPAEESFKGIVNLIER